MWELWERKTPFSTIEYAHFLGMERMKKDILNGVRPALCREVGGEEGERYVSLMKRCWAQESRDRFFFYFFFLFFTLLLEIRWTF